MNEMAENTTNVQGQDHGASTRRKELEIQLHLAEYNALTTRCTYFTNIQNVLLTAVVIWVTGGLLVSWNYQPAFIFRWGILFGMQIIGIISALLFYEENKIIRYLESELKPTIKRLIGSGHFWKYQIFIAKQRSDKFVIWEYSGVIIGGAVVAVIAITRLSNWEIEDFVGLSCNIILLVIYMVMTSYAVKTRKQFWKAL